MAWGTWSAQIGRGAGRERGVKGVVVFGGGRSIKKKKKRKQNGGAYM
jgi:hypothetical protein